MEGFCLFLWGELKEQTDKLVADCSFYQQVEMFLTVYQSIRALTIDSDCGYVETKLALPETHPSD